MNLTLRAKLLLLFLLVGVGPMATVGLVSYYNSVQSVEEVVKERALATAGEVAADLKRSFESRRGEAGLLARNQEIQDLYARYPGAGSKAVDQLEPRLRAFFGQFFTGPRESFVQVFYLDLGGNLVCRYVKSSAASATLLAQGPYTLVKQDASFPRFDLHSFQDREGFFLSNIYLPSYGPVLRLGRWIEDPSDGRRLGFLLADLEIGRLLSETRLAQQLQQDEAPVLIDRNQSLLLFHPQRALTGQPLAQVLPGLAHAYPQITSSDQGTTTYTERDEQWLLAGANLKEPAWTFGILTRPSRYTGPVRRAGLLNLGITLTAITLALILVPLVIGRITASIRKLTQGAEAIAAGDLDQQIAVGTRDETRTLAEAFNHMAQSLKTTLDELRKLAAELEDRVRRRTADLEEANQALSDANRELFSVNRQLAQTLEEKEQAQEALVRSESMAAIGTLVAGVAHELNNPLGAAYSLVQTVQEMVEEDTAEQLQQEKEEIVGHLAFSRKELNRAKEIVAALLGLSRQSQDYTEAVELNTVVQDALRVLYNQYKKYDLNLVEDYAEGLPPVQGNFAQLGQVCMNLIKNAIEALKGQEGQIALKTYRDEGYVVFECADTGPGMSEEVKQDIFKPFFTTKAPGEGTGLGLYICHQTVEKHRGSIEVESEVGKGTVFRVKLSMSST